ncbi:uncharacterized protein LOC100899437 [Galendromus occidentalis]|uniref:Uncharacterized protein LOC100899437 n=1 Tax=Galendromus occidentalis TaxID=34638 RepID=A0AAJ6QXT7_9ACAR|nr:uncharacterized protein LOC100899437 [Galendromus occidentalis]
MPVNPEFPHSHTGGVRPMKIEGRFSNPRARMSADFTDADRAWRAQFLKDQILAHDEPRNVPELYYATKNVIRRFYRAPFDMFERMIIPRVGTENAALLRRIIPKTLLGYTLLVWGTYWVKYNGNDWTRRGSWTFKTGDGVCLPCHEGYPRKRPEMKPSDYDSLYFKDRKVLLDL